MYYFHLRLHYALKASYLWYSALIRIDLPMYSGHAININLGYRREKLAPMGSPDFQFAMGTIFIKFGHHQLEIWTI